MGRVAVAHPETQRRKNWAHTQAYILLKANHREEHARNREHFRLICSDALAGAKKQNWVAARTRALLIKTYRAEWDRLLKSKLDEFNAEFPEIHARIEARKIAAFQARRPKVQIDNLLEVSADWIAQCRSGNAGVQVG